MINLPIGVTPLSQHIYHLHMLSYYICLGITTIVFVSLIYLLIKYRKREGQNSHTVHSNLWIELTWILIPAVLLAIMAIPATRLLMRINTEEQPELNIKITGYQWKWQYEYLDEGIQFFSSLATPIAQLQGKAPKGQWYLLEVDHPLVVPIHKKIRFLVTSNDVIHSWWVPALGIKRDAIPGFIYESWAKIDRPGIYRGQCAELCGIHHGFMPIVVEAKTEADFAKWIAENKGAPASLNNPPVDGEALYIANCSACHKLDGKGMPSYIPALQGGKIATGPVGTHIDIVLNGRLKTAMPGFAHQLNDRQIAAIINYERNSWGNNDKLKYGDQAGGSVQPEDISKAREH